MRSNRGWLWGLLFVLLCHGAGARAPVNTLAELQTTLSAYPVVRGTFKQVRTLEMFNQPLVSTGHFLLSEELGLQWVQTQPFSIMLVLGSDQLSQQFSDQPARVMKAEENPMMFHFSRLFLSIFRGETDGLEAQFELEFEPSKTGLWLMRLTPKQGPLKGAFKTITLQGQDHIQSIRLEETTGDVNEIYFSDLGSQPATLTEVERRAFEF